MQQDLIKHQYEYDEFCRVLILDSPVDLIDYLYQWSE